jgi:HSP20 family molecular chaperone IbpA
MTEEAKAMEVQEQERVPEERTERIRDKACYLPQSDIFETEENYYLVLDMPGVEENSIDITLEKNTLTINGYTDVERPEGYSLARAEYNIGDYERSFRLTDQIDRDKIEASYENGVLRLSLPKAEEAKARKIEVKTG